MTDCLGITKVERIIGQCPQCQRGMAATVTYRLSEEEQAVPVGTEPPPIPQTTRFIGKVVGVDTHHKCGKIAVQGGM
jgi:hypothetical protein